MNKIATDLEQSKKLAEILPLESADFVWLIGHLHTDGPRYEVIRTKGEVSEPENYWPCWSLAALEGLMPFHIVENNNRFGFYQVKGFNKQGETYRFGYKTNNDFFLFETSWYNDAIDAAFEMVCWLKENHKI